MRYRPKLVTAITRSLNIHFRGGCADAAATLVHDLDDAGYDIIEKRTRRRERHNQQVDAQCRLFAEQEAESARGWGEAACKRERRLEDRCSFLYEMAVKYGAPPDELRGPEEVDGVGART